MKISFITDEFTQNIEEAIMFAKEYRIQGLELRSIDNKPIHMFSLAETRNLRTLLDENGLCVSNISSSFFKCIANSQNVAKELRKLEVLCKIAEILECNTIRGFAFFREDNEKQIQELLVHYENATEILKKYQKRLLLESDPSVNTTNHQMLAELLSQLDTNYYAAVYDPGNCLYDPYNENPFPTAYQVIAPYLKHIHIKDVVRKDGELICVAPGEGLVGFHNLLKQLKQDGYNGWLSLEPHYRKGHVLTEEQMRLPTGTRFSDWGYQAMQESVESLYKLLENINWSPENG